MTLLRACLATVLVTRFLGWLAIYYFPFIYFDKWYHLYYGLIVVAAAILIKRLPSRLRLIGFGIGLGWIADGWPVVRNFFVGPPADPIGLYWSPAYILPLLAGLLLIALGAGRLEKLIRS